MSVININKATKSFGKNQVLINVNFKHQSNEILGIFGRNGSGKTTLLKILFGTLKADDCEIILDSEIYHPRFNIKEKRIGYLPQENYLPLDLKVRNVIPMYFPDGRVQDDLFHDPQIARIANQWVGTLSFGEKRYLEILMILHLPHPFLMLDEPFTMIEPMYQEAIKELLKNLKDKKGIILTDHYYRSVLEITDRNIIIKNGETFELQDRGELIDFRYFSSSHQF